MCPENIFGAEPDNLFSSILIGTILLEIIIQLLQVRHGALFFIPKRCRRGYFDYYKNYEQAVDMKFDIYNVRL
jgi:hypothetical protein